MSPSTTISDIASLSAEAGLISSQGEAKIPFGKKQTLMLAACSSLLELLHSDLLKNRWNILFLIIICDIFSILTITKISISTFYMATTTSKPKVLSVFHCVGVTTWLHCISISGGTKKIIEFCISLVITTMLISVSMMPPPICVSIFQLLGAKTKPK